MTPAPSTGGIGVRGGLPATMIRVMAESTGGPSNTSGPTAADGPRGRARRMVRSGLWVLGSSVVLALLPVMWGRWDVNRYFVAFGLLGALLGTSMVLHGAWDWVRSPKQTRESDGGR